MFHKAKLKDEKYYTDFLNSQAELIKSRVQLLCILAVGLYLLASAITISILPKDFNPIEVPWILTLIVCSLLIRYLIGKVESIKTIKFFAYLFVVVLLIIVTKTSTLYPGQSNMSEAVYLFILFLVSFTVPWKPIEIIPLTLMHTTAYIFLFYYMKSYNPTMIYVPAEYREGLLPIIGGLVILVLGFVLCLIIRKKEFLRDFQNFTLLKEIRMKNEQMHKELEVATKVHKTLIPKSLYTDLVDVAVMYLPMSYIGGDYAKFHFMDKDRLIFIICDVTGHGVSAALLVNRVHSEFERLVKDGQEPGHLLKELNDFIVNDFQGTDMYLSAFCCMLDFKKMKVSYSNHGHPSQYIYKVSESNIEHLKPQAGLLGLPFMSSEIAQHEMNFNKGDKLVLFTDGVIEARNEAGNDFGKDRVESFIKENYLVGADSFNQKLIDELRTFKHRSFDDDIFIVTIDVKP